MHLKPEEKAVLLLGRDSLKEEQTDEIKKNLSFGSFHWELFYNLCFVHGLWGFVLDNLNGRFPYPGEIKKKLSLLCQSTAKRNDLLFEEQKKILNLLNREGIAAILLKGIGLSQMLYGEKWRLKSTTDIDLLVGLEDVPKTIFLLQKELGYGESTGRKINLKTLLYWDKDISLYKKKNPLDFAPSILELHWSVAFNSKIDRRALQAIWKEKTLGMWENISLWRMNKVNELLFLLVHGSKHRWECLRHLLDVHEYVLKSNFKEKEWEEITDKAFYFGWERFCMLGLALAQALYDTPVPAEILETLGKNWIKKEKIFSSPSSFPYVRHFSLFELFSSKKDKLFFALKSLRFPSEEIVKHYPLPSFLSFLYIPLSASVAIFHWLRRNFASVFLRGLLKKNSGHLPGQRRAG
ncbi:nucleotidyltransferase domain-containing protein [Candidatus Methylacidiphilum infernorum]|uniref:Nucleotidyltransferase family protein n=1 Tax=Methylacidiphilum infernorum (isolate V4) TaxID=481448 RepID=B3DZF9_METI4|nr:nucleotidyltransferase family protein [Candidatus Methylacidiphilum infernorum]ACD82576.1 Conserved hypothetical protein [Methylacidiphilum infernorum V4]